MLKKRHNFCYFFFKARRKITSCALPFVPSNSSISTVANDHISLCLSSAEQLIRRGLLSHAQQFMKRIVMHSSSDSDALLVFNFASSRGLELDLDSYGVLLRKLVSLGRYQLAEYIYCKFIGSRGMYNDLSILNSMVICFCKLGKLEEARIHLDRIFTMNSIPCKAACNTLIRELCSQEMILEAFAHFVRISDARLFLGFWSFNVLIDGLCSKGYMDEALQVFNILCHRHGRLPTTHLYKTLFYGHCNRGQVVEAELLFIEMESKGLYIDKVMYTSLINEYCKNKEMKMAMRVFLRMLKMGCDPDAFTCNTLIRGYMKLCMFDKGLAINKLMTEWGVQPNVSAFGIMISEYCKNGEIDYGLMLLNKMVSFNLTPSVHCYTILIKALLKKNRLSEVDELYNSMLDRGVVPDHILFFVLVKKCPKVHYLELALKILRAIAKNGCGFDLSLILYPASQNPSQDVEQEIHVLLGEIATSNLNLATMAVNVYIHALCMDGNLDVALHWFDRMRNLGCIPSLFTYNTLIKCFCQEELFEYAVSLIDLMEGKGIVPDQATYLVIINECCKQGDPELAFHVMDDMDGRGMKPGVAIYDSIIGCLSRRKRILDAENMFKRMLEAGVAPDEVVYSTMINGYLNNGRATEAHQLFKKMVDNSIWPSLHCYTALISGLVKRNMTDKGCEHLDRMLKDGLLPNAVLYTSLINNYLKKGRLEFAFRLVDLMCKCRIAFDHVMCISLVSGVCRNIMSTRGKWHLQSRESALAREKLFGLLHKNTHMPKENSLRVSASSFEEKKCFAMKLIQTIIEKTSSMQNLYLYNSIISGYCYAEKMQEAYGHFELMQREGLHPNQVTYTILMDGHLRSGDIDSAIGIFNKMNADGCLPDRIAYNTLLRGLCKAGRLLEALSLSYAMHKRGFFPNKVSYDSLLNCFCASGLGNHAFKLFEEMVALDYMPCQFNSQWLLCMLYKKNKLREALIVNEMLVVRGKPSKYNKETFS
ncbi:hypothetical protein FEM48_ZijujUnG0024000 [Ziziphus jujuba var. spinosa]|uniref:Pentatricopeptide repeat-containing protein At5g62370 n=1 Tax=Ziziphus jujuba var. spinosa TaxID=714518 RepID=A0A978U9Q2_ZIZJJ|nr:pentatricopeptide repeat-containing protein At5g62370 isoform X1 [Ziziphus jujuba var. spinosa]KAH7511332.1 hypothetical protein FEM48_ZijujUnG0024000 [Ziziphus jujuba var. spinosa]